MKNLRFILLSLLLTGCSIVGTSQPTLFYTLMADPERSTTAPQNSDLSIGLGPISLPQLLDRPQMVLRRSETQIDVDEFHRWGEDLQDNLAQVMVQNLMAYLHTDRVARYPWPDYRRLDYQVVIEIFQFDGQLGESVTLAGVWSLIDNEQELAINRFSIHETIASKQHKAVADALSRAVIRLSQQIAKHIQGLLDR